MAERITDLPLLPNGSISTDISIPVSLSETDPKTYKMTLQQHLAFLEAQGVGAGASGYSGATGPQGPAGTGAQGPQGGVGSLGPQGIPGSQGFSGFSGASGWSGLSGPSGFSGFQGDSGASGWSGSSGFSGVSGASGFSGPAGANNGNPGPGLVYTGYYRGPTYVYYDTPSRVDVTSYSGASSLVYYIARSNTLSSSTFSGYTGWGTPGVDTADWASFGQNFESVATDLLLTQDVAVTQGIVLGTVGDLSAGFIRTANADWPGTSGSHGVWLGNYTDGNAYFFVGNYPNNGILYRGDTGQLQLSGTIFANAGSIGGVGIASGQIYTGNPSTAGQSTTPVYINGTYDDGTSDRSYFSLGNALKYYRYSGTNYFNLSGGVTALYGSIGGVGIASGVLYTGNPLTPGTSATPFFLNGAADPGGNTNWTYFTLGDKLAFFRASGTGGPTNYFSMSGGITATYGSIAGVGMYSGTLYTGNPSTAGANTTPFFLNGNPSQATSNVSEPLLYLGNSFKYYKQSGASTPYYRFLLGDTTQATNNYLYWDGSNLVLKGALYLTDGTTPVNSTTAAAAGTAAANTAFASVSGGIFTDSTGKIIGTPSPTSAGLYLGSTYMGYYNGSAWKTFTSNTGHFYCSGTGTDFLGWDGSNLTIQGSITLTDGSTPVNAATASGTAQAINNQSSGYLSNQISSVSGFTTGVSGLVFNNGAGLINKPAVSGTTGLYIGSNFMGYYNGAWKTYMDSSGNFGLVGSGSNSLTWDGTTLNVSGTIHSTNGTIGGWTIGSTTLAAGNVTIDSSGKVSSTGAYTSSYLGSGNLTVSGYGTIGISGYTDAMYVGVTGGGGYASLAVVGGQGAIAASTAISTPGTVSGASGTFNRLIVTNNGVQLNNCGMQSQGDVGVGPGSSPGNVLITASSGWVSVNGGIKFADGTTQTTAGGGGGGAQGAQGASGWSGAHGAQGATGAQGAQGSSGFSGYQGATGAQGATTLPQALGTGDSPTFVAVYAGDFIDKDNTTYHCHPQGTTKLNTLEVNSITDFGSLQALGGNFTVDSSGNVTANSYNTSSSRRWKTNIKPITNATSTISKLQGVTFDWNNRNIKNDFGLIAEDVNVVLPTIVSKDDTSSVTGLDYGRLTALLIETVKELNERIKTLESR